MDGAILVLLSSTGWGGNPARIRQGRSVLLAREIRVMFAVCRRESAMLNKAVGHDLMIDRDLGSRDGAQVRRSLFEGEYD